jgi:hypothetical protein
MLDDCGPRPSWEDGCTPEQLIEMGRSLVDAGRAWQAGDDPVEIALFEWRRRRAKREVCPDGRKPLAPGGHRLVAEVQQFIQHTA